jgi:uncharacterized protein (TIGR02246 family)
MNWFKLAQIHFPYDKEYSMVWTQTKFSLTFLLIMIFVPTISWAQKQASLPDADSTAIKQVVAGFTDSYNRHNAQDVAKWFTADGDFTTVQGATISGRPQIEEHFVPLFAGRLKDVHREVVVRSLKLLTPDVVSAYMECVITGSKGADGSALPARKGLYDWILTKQGGHWLISVFHESDLPSPPA